MTVPKTGSEPARPSANINFPPFIPHQNHFFSAQEVVSIRITESAFPYELEFPGFSSPAPSHFLGIHAVCIPESPLCTLLNHFRWGMILKKPELPSGGQAPCGAGFRCSGGFQEPICKRAPAGGGVQGCVRLQWNVFRRLLPCVWSSHDGGLPTSYRTMHLPTPHCVFSRFWPKTTWSLCPPFTWSCPKWHFLFIQMKKFSKRNTLLK